MYLWVEGIGVCTSALWRRKWKGSLEELRVEVKEASSFVSYTLSNEHLYREN